MTLRRLAALLDAFGARPERWPAAERAAALALVRVSHDAQRLQHEAGQLDAVLDRAPVPVPSAALFDRVLVAERQPASMPPGAPRVALRPVSRHRRVLVAGGSLAAAAALTLWLALGSRPSNEPILPAALAEIGSYATATDALLAIDDLDFGSTAPLIGCSAPGDWGCPDLEVPQEHSTTDIERRTVT